MRWPTRAQWAWAGYDWANSAFATVVMAGFFPVFFQQVWHAGADPGLATLRLGLTNALGSLAIMLLAPLLGAVADQGGAKKRFLARFTLLGAAATAALAAIAQGDWWGAAALYATAVFAFQGAVALYDALLVQVADAGERDRVSALGYALGYLGGGVLFALCVAMTLVPQRFGLTDAGAAVRVSFALTALWWLAFAIPLWRWVPEAPRPGDARGRALWHAGLAQLRDTLAHLRAQRAVWLFLLAYWLYIDGVDTVIRMAVDYGLRLGFESRDLILALLLTQFIGFPAALAFGALGTRIGARAGIFIGLGVYVAVTVWGALMQSRWEFYTLAAVIGLVQGGVQALSRSYFSTLIPPGRAGEFFGFYNMLGKFAALIGPLLVGGIGWLSGSPRVGLLSLLLLFLSGALLLYRVPESRDNERGNPAT